MKVKELIKKLKEFDENMEVQYDYDGQFSTMPIDRVSVENEYYKKDRKKVVVLY